MQKVGYFQFFGMLLGLLPCGKIQVFKLDKPQRAILYLKKDKLFYHFFMSSKYLPKGWPKKKVTLYKFKLVNLLQFKCKINSLILILTEMQAFKNCIFFKKLLNLRFFVGFCKISLKLKSQDKSCKYSILYELRTYLYV